MRRFLDELLGVARPFEKRIVALAPEGDVGRCEDRLDHLMAPLPADIGSIPDKCLDIQGAIFGGSSIEGAPAVGVCRRMPWKSGRVVRSRPRRTHRRKTRRIARTRRAPNHPKSTTPIVRFLANRFTKRFRFLVLRARMCRRYSQTRCVECALVAAADNHRANNIGRLTRVRCREADANMRLAELELQRPLSDSRWVTSVGRAWRRFSSRAGGATMSNLLRLAVLVISLDILAPHGSQHCDGRALLEPTIW